jgi:hypothetical protein
LLTRNDLLDILFEQFARHTAGAGSHYPRPAAGRNVVAPALKSTAKQKRIFLSDRELRRMRKPGAKEIEVPAGAIISPLAKDWIDYEGIKIVFK